MRSLSGLILLVAAVAQAAVPQPPSVIGKSWIVGDLSSGQILALQKADERFEPASLTKLMTAYVVFGALRDNFMTSFKFSNSYYVEATFGQYRDWMVKVRAGYTSNGSATGANFAAEQIGLTVVRRF